MFKLVLYSCLWIYCCVSANPSPYNVNFKLYFQKDELVQLEEESFPISSLDIFQHSSESNISILPLNQYQWFFASNRFDKRGKKSCCSKLVIQLNDQIYVMDSDFDTMMKTIHPIVVGNEEILLLGRDFTQLLLYSHPNSQSKPLLRLRNLHEDNDEDQFLLIAFGSLATLLILVSFLFCYYYFSCCNRRRKDMVANDASGGGNSNGNSNTPPVYAMVEMTSNSRQISMENNISNNDVQSQTVQQHVTAPSQARKMMMDCDNLFETNPQVSASDFEQHWNQGLVIDVWGCTLSQQKPVPVGDSFNKSLNKLKLHCIASGCIAGVEKMYWVAVMQANRKHSTHAMMFGMIEISIDIQTRRLSAVFKMSRGGMETTEAAVVGSNNNSNNIELQQAQKRIFIELFDLFKQAIEA